MVVTRSHPKTGRILNFLCQIEPLHFRKFGAVFSFLFIVHDKMLRDGFLFTWALHLCPTLLCDPFIQSMLYAFTFTFLSHIDNMSENSSNKTVLTGTTLKQSNTNYFFWYIFVVSLML